MEIVKRRTGMKNSQTANQLGGRAIGSIFFAVFGAIWLLLSLYAKEMLTVTTVTGVLTGMAVLLGAAQYLLRLAKRWPRVPDDPAMGRAFAWINVIQWISVAVVAITLAKLHLDAYVISAIAAIVGLHLFPLARLFRYPLHYATGALLVAWALASALFVPVEEMQGTAALGTGAILWLSAAATLTIALRAARRFADPQAC
jgi:hypothetical protein